MTNKINTTKLFSNAVDYYDASRPSYPLQIFEHMQEKFGFNSNFKVADIGSGTGIFSKLLLERGNHVFSVEPNDEMRAIAEKNLSKYCLYNSIAATAENTTLSDHSIDAITAATSFHWFNHELTKVEFKRILKPNGLCILLWNTRDKNYPIMRDYEALMKEFVPNYKEIIHRHHSSDEIVDNFFYPKKVKVIEVENRQQLTFEGFKGRILSAPYAPKQSTPNYQYLLHMLREIFNKYESENLVDLYYRCKCYIGQF